MKIMGKKTSLKSEYTVFYLCVTFGKLFLFVFFFGCVAQLAGSLFPDQGLNLGHGSESAKS